MNEYQRFIEQHERLSKLVGIPDEPLTNEALDLAEFYSRMEIEDVEPSCNT